MNSQFEITSLKNELSNYSKKEKRLLSQIEDLKKSSSYSNKQINNNEIQKLYKDINEYKSKINSLNIKPLKNLRLEIDNKTNEITSLKSDLTFRSNEVSFTKSELNNRNGEINNLKLELNNKDKEVENLRN
ncbi:hypothetical protein H8356DRAFT_1382262 [Neocallimastix lanati (nom. inval.)]|uniref:Uncharacterized protein n=1 Tax=Neocallimastix californiae TaxID=1754190 RepID=A0A1Y2F3I5_9FUNG|nr:hypothetical protein H8356DRAFT_1382262 [Neocallimastix sp. JGI-2020a]ORY77896.1 hypothetical protein LY90DRAFT_501213 [Neocallimastix californiae]|eukprot:ORY77896.1 hypothetical protein LY90DRAFT_501213 [Neocallimastix californiae]